MKKGRMLILVLLIACLSGCIWLCSGVFSEKTMVKATETQTLIVIEEEQAQCVTTGKTAKKEPSLAATKPVLTREF